MLLKPGEESHSYEPTPQDILSIQKAGLFIYVGGENDEWVEEILDAPEMEKVHTLRLVDCVEVLEEEYKEGMQKERGGFHKDEDGEEPSGDGHLGNPHFGDEHVWTSPKNAVRIVERITRELCALDEGHAQIFKERAAQYEEQLSELDEDFRAVVTEGRAEGKQTLIFGDRFPFRYFTQEYGLDYYAAFPGCASDTEPSAATMAFLIDKVKTEKIPVVLKMELSNENIANAIAEATKTRVRVFYSCHNLTAEQFESGESYLSLMKKNVETLKEALGIWR